LITKVGAGFRERDSSDIHFHPDIIGGIAPFFFGNDLGDLGVIHPEEPVTGIAHGLHEVIEVITRGVIKASAFGAGESEFKLHPELI
jgi:hypothetical protein